MTFKNPDMLQAIGRVAVQAALFEQQLHVAYWRYAGLSIKAGQIITERMNPKRIFEDLIKIASTEFQKEDPLRPPKAIAPTPARLADLKDIASIYGGLAQQRNEVMHWIWKSNATDDEHVIFAPGYMRDKEGISKPYTSKQINKIADGLKGLIRRMVAHYTTDQELQSLLGTFAQDRGAELFPAPWLDKSSRPSPKPRKTPRTRK